jgi:hypothetical protein
MAYGWIIASDFFGFIFPCFIGVADFEPKVHTGKDDKHRQ